MATDRRTRSVWMTYRLGTDDTDPTADLEVGAPFSGEITARRSLDTLDAGWRVIDVPFGTSVADAVKAKLTGEGIQGVLPTAITDAVEQPAKRTAARKATAAKKAASAAGADA